MAFEEFVVVVLSGGLQPSPQSFGIESRIGAAVNAGREDARVIGVAGEPWEGVDSSPAFVAPPSELEGSARRNEWIHAGHAAALVLARIA